MGLYHIRQHAPLVHCISNIVVANFKANGLLAIGASPVMADAPEEVAQMVAIAGALSINMGTLNSESVKAMLAAGIAANNLGVPVVFDPVGAGATEFRRTTTERIMQQVKLAVLRCNIGELAAVAGVAWQQKGVDAGEGDIDTITLAKQVATQYQTVVAVTGEVDIVTDGERVLEIAGGSTLTPQVTGTGCLLSAVVAASLVGADNALEATASVLQDYKRVAEQAAAASHQAVGSFQVAFLNALQQISTEITA
ncbi:MULTISPECIES: hydroxyethylthiazole kinase [Vitreoscilla]|uniref:Hydroxyethylthiazole kinase n=1 Tax=Vitreoscilla stercoraria TaxID=61 RepID=A0ABY4EAL0_VITST|nr:MULTISPECIES: hydroxyethylthiazole kinase [Vitreoscilla]AUZ04292.1 hydroxyethylthiazole kinase [Vitreoscilla sp. C1]UOO91965.1 hydroxyethylthiazole kinase [Vitreoscilla stercoraria]